MASNSQEIKSSIHIRCTFTPIEQFYLWFSYVAIQVLCNEIGGGRVSDFPEKALRRCTIQRY